jgi:hypothetical protein
MPEVITVWKPGKELRFKGRSTPPLIQALGFLVLKIDAAHLAKRLREPRRRPPDWHARYSSGHWLEDSGASI